MTDQQQQQPCSYPGLRYSVTLCCMFIPCIIRATDEALSLNKDAIVFTYLRLSLYRTETACFRPTVSSSMAFTKPLLILCILCVVHERSALGDKVGPCSNTLTIYWLVE